MITKEQKIRTCLSLGFLLAASGMHLLAQAVKKQPNVTKNEYHWDLSLDTYKLFKSGVPSMMLRYAKNPERSALRLNLGFDYNQSQPLGKIDSLSPAVPILTQSFLNSFIEGGVEFRRTNGRFQLFYGPSVSFSWYKQKIVPSKNWAQDFESSTVTVGKPGAGVFMGVRYFLLKRLALSSETSLNYFRQSSKNYIGKDKDQAAVTRAYGFQLVPLSNLHVSFFF